MPAHAGDGGALRPHLESREIEAAQVAASMWLLIRISEPAASDPGSPLAKPMSLPSPNRGMVPSDSQTPCALRRCPPARAARPPRELGARQGRDRVQAMELAGDQCASAVAGARQRHAGQIGAIAAQEIEDENRELVARRDPRAACRPRKSGCAARAWETRARRR